MPAQQVGIAGAEECRWLRLAQDRLIGQRGQLRHDLACRRRLGQHRQRWNLAHEDTVVLCALPVDHGENATGSPGGRAAANSGIVLATDWAILPPPKIAGSTKPLTKSTIHKAGLRPIPTVPPNPWEL